MPEFLASHWMNALASGPFPFAEIYEGGAGEWEARARLLRAVIGAHLDRFGDGPLRVFRSPGRINLRGMHVDTHGGYLNLMTHQREAVVAARPSADDTCVWRNIDSRFEECTTDTHALRRADWNRTWLEYLEASDTVARLAAQRGRWSNYAEGAWLSVHHLFPDAPLKGLQAAVGSDIPRGAALSSSHALSVAAMLASAGCNGRELAQAEAILAARNAEWYAGARSGTSDQGAMILGRRNTLVNVALFAAELDVDSARYFPWPDAVCVLAVHSHTERSLSGAALVGYTRNRFAYSMAMEILRQELARLTGSDSARYDRFARLGSDVFEPALMRTLLSRIPEQVSLQTLRERYELPQLDALYQQSFGSVPESERPAQVALRGPLLFGLAESERARIFCGAISEGDFALAGRLMTLGHEGDRVSGKHAAVDGTLDAPLWTVPGVYRASSPVLDLLVDTALEAGALGASLTGAGMAGTVLALCERARAQEVAAALRDALASEAYQRLAQRGTALSSEEVAGAIVENRAPAGACELRLPG